MFKTKAEMIVLQTFRDLFVYGLLRANLVTSPNPFLRNPLPEKNLQVIERLQFDVTVLSVWDVNILNIGSLYVKQYGENFILFV